MGIPYYFYNVYKKYANDKLQISEHDLAKYNISDLYLDYNSMIHPCCQVVLQAQKMKMVELNVTNDDIDLDDLIIDECLRYTRYIISVVKPKNVYIMIDGVAPRAKINQQRERRYKSYFFKKLSNEIVLWDTNNITPGTMFMKRLSNSLHKFKENFKDINIVISDADIQGEGEHKMMNHIIKSQGNDKICIYGLDADLIMLSLLNLNSHRIILLRDNTFNEKNKSDEKFAFIDISKLQNAICRELRSESESRSNREIIVDYIFLCFMLGNDFLEHLPSLMIKENGLQALINNYIKVQAKYGTSLVKGHMEIDICMFRDILQNLAQMETYFYKHVYSVYKNKSGSSVYRDTINLEESYSEIYFYKNDLIKYNEDGYKRRYYQYYGNGVNINEMCQNYMIGLHWVLGYYNNHQHGNWTWFYRYHATPMISDLYNYLVHNQSSLCTLISQSEHLRETKCLKPIEQLFMVLPGDSLKEILKLLDVKLYRRFCRCLNNGSIYMEKSYPKKISVDMIHKEYLWQSKLFLEEYDKQLLNYLFY